jgi:phage N-6-adenine-methyltransferase
MEVSVLNMAVHYSRETPEWETPQALFDELHAEFDFQLDPCCTVDNRKCGRYFTSAVDGLTQLWAPYRTFMNPPYGVVIKHWMRKAYEESRLGALVVCLVPSRTDTYWWRDYAMKGEIRYIRGRIRFSKSDRAPFPSCLVIFRPTTNTSATKYPADSSDVP